MCQFSNSLLEKFPGGQNILILQRIKDAAAPQYYLEATARYGWTRNVLLKQIKANAWQVSQEAKTHNFQAALPAHLAILRQRHLVLVPEIECILQADRQVYSADKVWRQLNGDGSVALCTVERLIQPQGL